MRAKQPARDAVEGGEAARRDDLFVSRESKTRSYGMATALPPQGGAALDRGWAMRSQAHCRPLMYGDSARSLWGYACKGLPLRRYLTIINPPQQSVSLFQAAAVFGAHDIDHADVEPWTA